LIKDIIQLYRWKIIIFKEIRSLTYNK
jgi:hypothetical protein